MSESIEVQNTGVANETMESLPSSQLRLHSRAVVLARIYRETEAELVCVLQELDRLKTYYLLGRSSLFEYCTKTLELTDSTAYMFISVARKAKELPELQKAIGTGRISVSQARRVVPVLNSKNAIELLEFVETRSQKEVERKVAEISPKAASYDREVFLTENIIELRFSVSVETYNQFKLIQDQESQRLKSVATFEDVLRKLVGEHSEREKRTLRGRVIQRDGGRCTQVDSNGRRCPSRRWLEIHHVLPRELGGKDELENLVTLCSGHHRGLHHELREHQVL